MWPSNEFEFETPALYFTSVRVFGSRSEGRGFEDRPIPDGSGVKVMPGQ